MKKKKKYKKKYNRTVVTIPNGITTKFLICLVGLFVRNFFFFRVFFQCLTLIPNDHANWERKIKIIGKTTMKMSIRYCLFFRWHSNCYNMFVAFLCAFLHWNVSEKWKRNKNRNIGNCLCFFFFSHLFFVFALT